VQDKDLKQNSMSNLSEDKHNEIRTTLRGIAKGYVTVDYPTPVLETPKDYGMVYEDVKFTAEDGVALAAWFIPAEGSDKLIICNHPATLNRYGWPGHKAPWNQFQDVEVKFGKVYKALHDAGYNVLTYDFRNHGESASSKGNTWGQGFSDEYKDVIAAFDYIKSQDQLKDMTIGLFNPCAGGNAAIHAMTERPEYFKDVKALVCPQPASINIMSKIALDGMQLGDYADIFSQEIEHMSGLKLEEMTPHLYTKNIKIPTFFIQVKDDAWTTPKDVQATFDGLTSLNEDDKKLFWVEGTTKRFDGYNYFGEHPKMMLEWFDKYMN
jgi:dipeptidyl aminopeptidase/acylaminoacyl peptidase